MKETIENRINIIANGLSEADNYLSEDLDAICDDTMREYAEDTLQTIQKSARQATWMKKNINLFLDALTDISALVGYKRISFDDSRKRNAMIQQWAEEFVELHTDTDWEQIDYILKVDEFAENKLSDCLEKQQISCKEESQDKPNWMPINRV